MSKIPTDVLPRFIEDIATHQIEVVRDDGVNRHLRFRKPNTSAYWFDIITWPGTLTIDGDMGTYVFKRLPDMFEFFRVDIEYAKRKGVDYVINPGYWAEKLQAMPKDGYEEFNADAFRARVKEEFDQWVESEKPYGSFDDDDCTKEQREAFDAAKADLWDELQHQVLNCADDGDIRAHDAARDFSWREGDLEFSMVDCWEWNCKVYTFHYIWCCYAIVWAIKAYDATKAEQETTVTA